MKARLTMRAALALGLPCAARRFCRALLDRAGHEAGQGNVVTAAALVCLYLAGL